MLAMGVFEDTEFKQTQQEISPGQIILIATDGLWEARNPEGEMFGKDRIQQIIRRNAAKTAGEIQDTILDSLKRFQRDAGLEDDMTLVVIKNHTLGAWPRSACRMPARIILPTTK